MNAINSLRVEIKSTELRNLRDYKGRMYGEQQAALHGVGDFPLPFKINREEHQAYPAGNYWLDPSGFAVDERGNLRFSRVKLIADKPAGK